MMIGDGGGDDGGRSPAPSSADGGGGGDSDGAPFSSSIATAVAIVPDAAPSSSSSSSPSSDPVVPPRPPRSPPPPDDVPSSSSSAVVVASAAGASSANAVPPKSSSSSSSSASSSSASAPPPPVTRGSSTATTNATTAPSAAAAAPPLVVARPPLNVYLRLAVIRDERDVVVCEDPERPGRRKAIPARQLSSLGGGNGGGGNGLSEGVGIGRENDRRAATDDDDGEDAGGGRNESEHDEGGGGGKKEIPVPTITTVRRYDRDVPPDFDVPGSYVRHIRPTYEEATRCAVEYNVDADDEGWWAENADFGPRARVKIIVAAPPPAAARGGEEEQEEDDDDVDENDDVRMVAPEAAMADVVEDRDGFAPSAEDAAEGGQKVVVGRLQQRQSQQQRQSLSQSQLQGKQQQSLGKQVGRRRRGRKSASSKKTNATTATNNATTEDAGECDAAMDVDEATGSDVSSAQPTHPPSSVPHDLTVEDVILLNPRYLHSRHPTRMLIRRYNPKLPLPYFERMIDALEKATGHESIVTIAQAEEVLVGRMPCLADTFGPLTERDRRLEEEEDERHLSRWLRDCDATVDGPTLAPPVTLPEVIRQVYNYWVAKRSRLRKPLLRRYWPPTSASDLNPHQVFRQRDKEKRRLRKKRQNDLEAYRKMRQLRADFERVGRLCDLILRREEVNSTLVALSNDYYEERMHRWTDTAELPRRSQTLDRSAVERALDVPRYFDDRPIVRTRGGNKRKRGPQTGWKNGSNAADGGRVPSPVPPPGAGGGGGVGGPHPTNPAAGSANNVPPHHHHHHGTMKPPPPMTAMSHLPPRNIVVAGHDGGFPAPNFLQPLASRESHFATSWDDAVPSMPSYVDGACTTSRAGPGGAGGGSFRHRPRLGRGGRVVIDRVPRPSTSSFGLGGGGGVSGPPAPTVVTYGSPMGRCGYHVAPLGADGPHYAVRSGGPDDDVEGGPRVAAEEGRGTDAKTAPRAPPARNLLDLLPKSLGDPTSLSRRIEEICALALMEDYQTQGNGGTATAVSASAASSLKGGSSNAASSAATTLAEEMDEILVPIEDWMEAPEGMRIYGSEKFVIGPL